MKNLLILALLSVLLSADNNQSVVKDISDEDFLKQMKELDVREEKANVELEKTLKFRKTLEAMAKKLEQEKLEMKKQKNPK